MLAAQRPQSPVEARAEILGGHDEAVAAQLLEPYRLLTDEPVAAAHQHVHPLAAVGAPREAGRRLEAEGERDVEPAADQLAHQAPVVDSETSAAMPGACSRSRASSAGRSSWRVIVDMPIRSVPSTPWPARVALANASVDGVQRGGAVGEQAPAGVGQLDVPRRAHEQLGAELGLELPDRLAQRRGGHVQPVGGAAEAQLLGDGHEVAQMAQLRHVPTL